MTRLLRNVQRYGLVALTMLLFSNAPLRADDEVLKPQSSSKPPLKKVKPATGNPQPTPPAAEARRSAPQSAPAPGAARTATTGIQSNNPAIQPALELWKSGDAVGARTRLNDLLAANPDGPDADALRKHLTQLADETIFGPGLEVDDPLIERYKVQSGEVLVKIARKFKLPVETLLAIRGGNHDLAAGEVVKIPRGPFHARISKSHFRLDLYLQDTYVHSFPVGLGIEGGTPLGGWKVGDRQRNPTWYPPPSAKDRQVRGPNDPLNPLGGFWIRLEGVSGEALGRTGFGIHGTIEPESVGKEASLGCIRMLPEDIAFVYRSLQPGASTVTVGP